MALLAADLKTDSYDDHALHVVEHTRFLLSAEFKRIAGGSVGALNEKGKAVKERFAAHIREHEEQAKEKEKNSPNGRENDR